MNKAGGSPAVSIVTPFYNTAKYLRESIESSLAQTFTDFELILVDNCSTDGSAQIALEFASRDARVRYFRNEAFLSQIQNYNRGLLHISPDSRYTKMVQADDMIFPRLLELMVAIGDAHPSAGIISSFRMAGDQVMPGRIANCAGFVPGREAARAELLTSLSLFGTQTSVMMRSDIVRHRPEYYQEGTLFPDTAAVYEALRDHDFAFVPEILSFTRIEDESLFGSWQSFGPMALARHMQLVRYGPTFLSPTELRQNLAESRDHYYGILARGVLQRRGSAFWAFHRRGLAEIGEPLDRVALSLAVTKAAVGYALTPAKTLSSLLRRLVDRDA